MALAVHGCVTPELDNSVTLLGMLVRLHGAGFLANTVVVCTYAHKTAHVEVYLAAVGEVFGILATWLADASITSHVAQDGTLTACAASKDNDGCATTHSYEKMCAHVIEGLKHTGFQRLCH